MPGSALGGPVDRAPRRWLGAGMIAAGLLALTALLVSRSAGVARFDVSAMAAMATLRRPELNVVAQFITDLGSYRPVTLISLLLALLIGIRVWRLLEPVVLLAAVEASSSLVEVLKGISDRARPPTGGMLGDPVFDFSFPSGHTASGAVLYLLGAVLLAQTLDRRAGRALLVATGALLAVLVGLSRVYLGYHWLTDVAGGWLLAVVLTGAGMAFVTAHARPTPIPIVGDVVAPRWVWSRPSWPLGAAPHR